MWLIYALLTALFYVGLDFCVKRAAGKIDDFWGMLIINAVAVIPALVGFLILKMSRSELLVTREGITWSILAGISIGLGSVTLIKMFSSGANLSIGSPLVRIGTVVGVVIVGMFFLRETLSVKQIFGLAVSIGGLFLLVVK